MKLSGATVVLSALLLSENGAPSSAAPLATGTRRLRNRAAYKSTENSARANLKVDSGDGGDPRTKEGRRELKALEPGGLSVPVLSLPSSTELDILPPRPVVKPIVAQPVSEEAELGLQEVVEEEGPTTSAEALEAEPYDPYLGMGSIPMDVVPGTFCRFCESDSALFGRSLAVTDEGLVIPNSVIPESNGLTCGQAFEHASSLSNEECSMLRSAEAICCPELAERNKEEEDALLSMRMSVSMSMNAAAEPTSPSASPVAAAATPQVGAPTGSTSVGSSAGTPTRMPADPPAPKTTDKLPSGATSMGRSCLVAATAMAVGLQSLL